MLPEISVPFSQTESAVSADPHNCKTDWNPDTNYYEMSGGFQALAKYDELFSNYFAETSAYKQILAAFDFGGIIPAQRIQLSGDSRRFKIFFEYGEELIRTLKEYGASWDSRRRIWNIDVGMNAVLLAKQLCSEGFECTTEIKKLIESHESSFPFSYKVGDGKLLLKNLALPEVHAFLRPRKRANFDPASQIWTILPDYETSQFLKETMAGLLDQTTIEWLQEVIDSANLLDQLSVKEKITHEENDSPPEGLVLVRGSRLHTICKKAKINYRASVSYGPRPFAKSIGIFILKAEKAKFDALAGQSLVESRTDRNNFKVVNTS